VELFSKEALTSLPSTIDPTTPFAWLANAVRQIRLHAFAMQVKPGQYAVVLAFHLFRAASVDSNCCAAEDLRRTYAYLLAERLLDMSWT